MTATEQKMEQENHTFGPTRPTSFPKPPKKGLVQEAWQIVGLTVVCGNPQGGRILSSLLQIIIFSTLHVAFREEN